MAVRKDWNMPRAWCWGYVAFGLRPNRVEDLPYRVEQLLGSKKLGEMGKLAKSLGRANAALAVCREVLERINDDR